MSRSLLIVFGSETGTAQDVAENLRREALQRRIAVRICAFDDCDVDMFPSETAIVFVVSTTGQGEFPPNMRGAWKRLLRKSLTSTFLSSVNVAVVGLGDSSYLKYNFAGKKLFRRLVQLGAKPLLDLGLADDQHEIGIDGALNEWRPRLWLAMHDAQLFDGMTREAVVLTLPPKFTFDYTTAISSISTEVDDGKGEFQELDVISNERVTDADHFQDTRLISFSTHGFEDKFRYSPGDVLMVRPCNLAETVEIAIGALDYSNELLDRPLVLKSNDPNLRPPPAWLVPQPTTLRTLLTRYFDLQMVPRRSFFEVLGSLSPDNMERERLLELASTSALDDLIDYCNRSRRTVAEALRDFPATVRNLDPERLFDFLTPIRARAFSIASSEQSHPSRIEILVAKVEYRSRMSVPRRGLCSTFLARLKQGDKVLLKIRQGTFRFPDSKVPVVCVGPGTGVAPFRSLLSARDSEPSSSQGLLFFGCRGRETDFYFSSEWHELRFARVITAFSRDSENKVYVQHKIGENCQLLWEMVHTHGAYVFIAGSSGDMPKAVTKVIDEIAISIGWSDGSYVEHLEKRGRMQYETWS